MADACKFEIPDLPAFLKEFNDLPASIQGRVIRGAVGTGSSVVRKSVVDLAPEYHGEVARGHPPPGTLKKAIYMTRLPEKCTPTLEAWKVGVRVGKRSRKGKGGAPVSLPDAYYASWVEFGHFTRMPDTTAKEHRTAVGAGYAGFAGAKWVPPTSFMRAGYARSRDDALKAMQRYFDENLALASATMRYIRART